MPRRQRREASGGIWSTLVSATGGEGPTYCPWQPLRPGQKPPLLSCPPLDRSHPRYLWPWFGHTKGHPQHIFGYPETNPQTGDWCCQPLLGHHTFQHKPISTYKKGVCEGPGQPPLSVQQLFQSPFYVHPMPNSSHPKIYQVFLLKVWQVAAVNLIVHERLLVFTQVQTFQPVCHVWFRPQVDRLSCKRLI